MAFGNPFARQSEDEIDTQNLLVYKISSIVSWAVNLVFTLMYVREAPHDGNTPRHTLFGQSNHHLTPFTPSHVFIYIWWTVFFITQLGYIWNLFSNEEAKLRSAVGVSRHFVLFNLLQFASIMLFARSHFVINEFVLIINFIQILSLYFRHSTAPRLIHVSAVTMPLTWTFYTIMWNGAIMVHCHSLACRIVANVAIWSFLLFGAFFLLVFKDYTVGFEISFLMAGLGVGQLLKAGHVVAFQWIFAFTIMAVVFIFSLIIAIPGIFGAETGLEGANQHHHTAGADRERAPLLEDA